AARIVAAAREAGVNFVDTADAYTRGESERILGPLIAKDRDRWVLATKVGNAMRDDDPNQRGTGRKWIMAAVDASLARLATDYVDLYYLHRDFESIPLEETVQAMADLIRAGKVRYFGVSNYRGWRTAELVNTCIRLGLPRPVASQPYYNLLNRLPENEILPACAHHGLGVVAYSPIARGVLTGKYAPGAEPDPSSRAGRKDRRMMETEFRAESLEIAQKLKAYAAKKGIAPGHFAVNWVLNNRIVTSVIGGPRTLEQWNDYVAAIGKPFDAQDEAFVDTLVKTGHPSTPGYNDPSYPIRGRVPRTG
ncbi:MAG TPA: aldo/keto reductase, partial [Usitatibacter sp.]|nr:aldo/keto reductase [Usitatibacter sp.]